MDIGLISLLVSLFIGIPQVYLAWKQVSLSREQARRAERPSTETRTPPPRPEEPRRPDPPTPDSPVPDRRLEEVVRGETFVEGPDAPLERVRPFILKAAPVSLALGGLIAFSSLGWIFGYDSITESYTADEFAGLPGTMWFFAATILASSVTGGATAYSWFRGGTASEHGLYFGYVAFAVVGPIIAVGLIIARRDIMF